ncbi:AI-2E family transporter [Caulobacter segnis]|uniref:AI-2E family transporter n=1 Tax=Caulobacter segnis TaxID=88688 RepID=UPI0028550B96|nr:AI-2E family transporter [Caulobacter segnis]MDR6623925.1 putative PurR-regulated permease PerM [Caulobacter segnis]
MTKPGTSFLVNFVMASALLYVFRAVLWPFTLALVLAILIIALSERVVLLLPKARRWTVFVITAVIVGGIIVASMAVVVEGASRIVIKMPAMLARIDQLLAMIPAPGGRLSLEALAQKVELGPLADRLLSSVQDASAGLGLTLIFLFFLLISRSMIEKRVQSIIASRGGRGLATVLERSFSGVESYMYVQSITGLMIAAGSWVVMAAVGLDNALFWSLVIFLFAYLPVLGVLAGGIGPTLFALLQFPGLTPAIVVFVGIQIVSSIVGNLVLPKMQADSQNIDPAASLIAVGMWTVLWGVPGAFLAIPLTLAVMYALAQYDDLRWLAVLISHDGDPTPMESAE